MNNKYKRTINKDSYAFSIWPSFTDLLCSILMVIILILFNYKSSTDSLEKGLSENVQKSISMILAKGDLPIKLDKHTGEITFSENTLFDVNSSELKPEAKMILKYFIPKYIDAIYKNYEYEITRFLIKGHTDDVGDYIYNLELSQNRALSVATFIVGEEIGDYKYKNKVRKNIEAIGRSEAELIKNTDGTVNRDASRRVEISYELKIK